jgi:hypothetical protein
MMRTGDIAGAVGKGLAAGMIGTAAITISSTIEARVRQREPLGRVGGAPGAADPKGPSAPIPAHPATALRW